MAFIMTLKSNGPLYRIEALSMSQARILAQISDFRMSILTIKLYSLLNTITWFVHIKSKYLQTCILCDPIPISKLCFPKDFFYTVYLELFIIIKLRVC